MKLRGNNHNSSYSKGFIARNLSGIYFDPKSIKFKLWAYFAIFAATLMLFLWFLQIFFLTTYYQEMKITETNRIASNIISQYKEKDFLNLVKNITLTNDLYIEIESTSGGRIIFPPYNDTNIAPDSSALLSQYEFAYKQELITTKKYLHNSQANSVSLTIPNEATGTNTLAYAAYLERTGKNEVILYVMSPLYPVESTVSILRDQLVYVTAISLLLAFILSFYLSNRITRPIRSINVSAKKLAEGNYGIIFQGGHYTEIINLAETLTQTSMQLQKASDLQKDLIANVSHDLRTPLTMVKSYAEMIRDISGENPEKRAAHLDVIIEEADRLSLLVSDVLTISKMQSGVNPLDKTTFDLLDAAESIVQTYSIYHEQAGFEIFMMPSPSALIFADEGKIKQVLSNLINNAVKFSGEEKKVQVCLAINQSSVRCEVRDWGMGIAKDELAQVWTRYYRASSNHIRTVKGTGLGLSIVQEILRAHNAVFGVESELGKGSTFWFEIEKHEPVKQLNFKKSPL